MNAKGIIVAILLCTTFYFVYEFAKPPKYKNFQVKSTQPKNEALEQNLESENNEEEVDEKNIKTQSYFSGSVTISGNSLAIFDEKGFEKKLNFDDFEQLIVEKDNWGRKTRWFLFKDGTKVKYSKEILKKAPKNVLYQIDYAHFSGNVENENKNNR